MAPAQVDSGTTTVPVDSGSAVPEASADVAVDTGYDAGLPPGTVAPSGTQLFASSTVRVQAVTSDGYAIYSDNSTNLVSAVAIAGGTPISIGPMDPSGYLSAYGAAVAIWSSTGATLSLWTAAHGLQMLSSTSTYSLAVSADNSEVSFLDGIDTSTGVGNLLVMGTDGSGRKTVATAVQAGMMSQCFPQLAFAGSQLLANYCSASSTAADAGFATATLASYAGPSWEPVTLSGGVYPGFLVSPSNTEVLVGAPDGLELYSVTGGGPTMVDPLGSLAAAFTNDSKSIVYSAIDSATDGDAGSVKRATVGPSPNPVSLAPSIFEGVTAISPDNTWALGFEGYNMNTENTDLYVLSTTAPGAARAIVSTQSVFYGAANFTADSSYVVYISQAPSGLTYPLSAAKTSGGAPTMIAAASYDVQPTSGAKVIFDDNFVANQVAGGGTADIHGQDLSQSAPSTLLVTQADALFFLSPDKTHLVYSWSYAPGPLAGVWVMPVP
jgi:hypothetical protein